MAETPLLLKINSAKDLNNVNLIGKMAVYAIVYITGAGNQDQKQKTHVDKDGDSNPTWNHTMNFTINESAALQNRLTLVVKIKAEGMFGDKDVGEVHVPIKELLDSDYGRVKPLQFVCYQVRKPSGQPKGELSFSYKFGEKSGVGKVEEPYTAYPEWIPDKADEPVMAYPAVDTEYVSVYPPLYPAPANAGLESYPPVVASSDAAFGSYPPAGGEYYPPPAGYPQPLAGYASQQQPAYGGYPAPATLAYGGYAPQLGYAYPPIQQSHQELGYWEERRAVC